MRKNRAVRLEGAIVKKAGNATEVRFVLPNGHLITTPGPTIDTAEVGPIRVVLYPERFVEIDVAEYNAGYYHQMRIPLHDLPL